MNYDKQSLNSRMAEVMGWKFTYKDMDNGFLYNSWCDGSIAVMPVGDWNPTEDANQALMVLEKWCDKKANRWLMIYLTTEMEGYSVNIECVWDKIQACSFVHPSLPVAICLAIASAEDSAQATLEEGE